ncbi:MAG: cytidine deaminase [Nanoarchaeota archaeon]|nr:cytidine deaminase [Nanoarchaeota archaeon]MBU4242367.1 cytidine deaminase [Nanoarchaeota archaeon]MBU4352157.1 cytidine deaminase [Nanoarchaeota archaeon]MBU4455919.1 cytidine deaminase [Nanoarchaeota archaeon]MCG2719819.1 cytidine deaminase [Nanoarchaeota archaeon]
MVYQRDDRDENWLKQARVVCGMGTCLRRRYGAIIVKDNRHLSQGYCGAAGGEEDCLSKGYCKRQDLQIPSGERYELCESVHAENNSVINAAILGVSIKGGTLYLCGEESESKELADAIPCKMCARIIINATLEKVITRTSTGGINIYTLDDLRQIIRN